MSRIITVDPVNRIEGHLKIQVEVENGKVVNAWTSGTLFRGLENILRGRKSEDAVLITQRACGVCPIPYSVASSKAIEDAYGIEIPDNARVIRNLIQAFQFLNSHILHFYHLVALDYVDPAAVAEYKGSDPELLDLKSLIAAGDTAPFTPRWDNDFRLPTDLNILATKHYIDAIHIYKRCNEAIALLGGKFPHAVGIVPGGATVKVTPTLVTELVGYAKELKDFCDNTYVPDVLAIAPYYQDYGHIGVGPGNFLAYGMLEGADRDPYNSILPRGVIFDGDINNVQELDPAGFSEHVAYSYYEDGNPRHPSEGETQPNFTGVPADPRDGGKYSWLKAPRLNGKPMEVGPLARMLVRQDAGLLDLAAKLKIGPSVLARIAARALEAQLIADHIPEMIAELKPDGKVACAQYEPTSGRGVGLDEAPRGAIGHWIEAEGGRIANYQMIIPTTWNAGPRDAMGQPGPYEQALIGTEVKDPERPIELTRIIRSFDPCIACAVHVVDLEKEKIAAKFQVGC
ncbi:MAG: nickel-dependent hydrogenase large subunit [Firmicutes bacterium]|nr:nickel-dependent hydrogenase large subunit [Bacillota bacterium]